MNSAKLSMEDIIDTLKDMQGGNIEQAMEYVKEHKVNMVKLIEYYTGQNKGMIVGDDDVFAGYLMMLWERLKY